MNKKEKKMISDLHGRSVVKITDLSHGEFLALVEFAARLRKAKRAGKERRRLKRRNIVLVFEKPSTRTRSAFEVGAHDQGAQVTYVGATDSHMGESESVKDTARVLGRMFDGIEYRGFAQATVDELAEYAGVPVWNGLSDQWHPTQMLADVLTMLDHTEKPLSRISCCYLGDGRNNTANSLLVTGALLGFDIRIAAPEKLWPSPDVRALAEDLGENSGARLTVTADVAKGVASADFLYTDVWLSMGDPPDELDERIDDLLAYQVNADTMQATCNPETKFMHCLPALHGTDTDFGRQVFDKRGLQALEVTDDVFESPASIVFDQAENRMHTIKALMVATIGD